MLSLRKHYDPSDLHDGTDHLTKGIFTEREVDACIRHTIKSSPGPLRDWLSLSLDVKGIPPPEDPDGLVDPHQRSVLESYVVWLNDNVASMTFSQMVASVLALGCWHSSLRSIEKTAQGDMSPTVDSTGSSLGDLIYSVHGLLDESSYDRLYLFGRSVKEMEGYFMEDALQRLGRFSTGKKLEVRILIIEPNFQS